MKKRKPGTGSEALAIGLGMPEPQSDPDRIDRGGMRGVPAHR